MTEQERNLVDSKQNESETCNSHFARALKSFEKACSMARTDAEVRLLEILLQAMEQELTIAFDRIQEKQP